MKSFFLTVLLFVLMLTTIVCNALYINRIAFDMQKSIDELPDIGHDRCAEFAEAFYNNWSKKTALVGLSVSYPILDRITEQAALLVACAECGDLYGYRSAIALLRDAIEDMERLEKLF